MKNSSPKKLLADCWSTDSNRTVRVECLRCHYTCQIFKCRFHVGQLSVNCCYTAGRQYTNSRPAEEAETAKNNSYVFSKTKIWCQTLVDDHGQISTVKKIKFFYCRNLTLACHLILHLLTDSSETKHFIHIWKKLFTANKEVLHNEKQISMTNQSKFFQIQSIQSIICFIPVFELWITHLSY